MRLTSPFTMIIGLLLAGAAVADTAPPRAPKIACRTSVLQLCPAEAISGDRQKMRVCLLKNLDKATTECQASVKAAQAEAAAAGKTEAAPDKP
jgi:hypothetical protein